MKLHIFMEITTACEGHCPWCPGKVSGAGPVPLRRLASYIDLLKDHAEAFHLSGGNPLSHPQILDVLQVMARSGKPYTIFTSGFPGGALSCLEPLKKDTLFRGFSFSIHGGTSSSHHALTGSLNIAEILATMKRVSGHGIPCRAEAVLGRHNRDEIKTLVRAVFAHGARNLVFSRYIGPYRKEISIPGHELVALLDHIREIGERGIPVGVSPCVPACVLPGSAPCPAGVTMAVVGSTGAVRPCPFTEFQIGSLDAGDFRSLWMSDAALFWRTGFPSRCRGCDLVERCRGGCRVFSHDFRLPADPLANYRRDFTT